MFLYLLGLLALIKCSICSYQPNIWYGAPAPRYLTKFFEGGFGSTSEATRSPFPACPWPHTTALWRAAQFLNEKAALGEHFAFKVTFWHLRDFFWPGKKIWNFFACPKSPKRGAKGVFWVVFGKKKFCTFPPQKIVQRKIAPKIICKKENTICVSWVRGFVRTAILRGKHRIPSDLRS